MTWMDLEGIMLSNSNRERQILFDLFYVELKTTPSPLALIKVIDTVNGLVVAVGEGWGVSKIENFF